MKTHLLLIPTLLLAGSTLASAGHPFTGQTILLADTLTNEDAQPRGLRKAKNAEAEIQIEPLPDPAGGPPGAEVNLDEILRRVETELRSALKNVDVQTKHLQEDVLAKTRDAARKAQGAVAAIKANPPIVLHSRAQADGDDEPELVVTKSLAAEARAEWGEDLRVMDKLLSEVVCPKEEPSHRMALGIPLWFSNSRQPAPMYVQDYGALFRYHVDFPLAEGADAKSGKSSPGDAGSAWDRAKKEIHSNSSSNAWGWGFSYSYSSSSGGSPKASVPYDAAKVDAMVDSVIDLLPEAKNIRHLGDQEFVTVTISGEDDQGKAVRLTLRAAKGDIEKAASGKLNKEEFRKRVERQVG